MKVLIISDIHANIDALKAIYDREKDCDEIYCAGDLVDMGPFPREVIAWMKEHDVRSVKGNHDQAVINAYRCGIRMDNVPPEERNWCIYNASTITEEDVLFLEDLPEKVTFENDGIPYLMKHLYYKYEMILSEQQFFQYWDNYAEGQFSSAQTRRCIFGHTHRRLVVYYNDSDIVLNPGSVSYNKGYTMVANMKPTRDAHYMTIEDGEIRMHSIEYDRSRLNQKSAEVLSINGGVSEKCLTFSKKYLLD